MIVQVGREQDFPTVFCWTFDIKRSVFFLFFFWNVTVIGRCSTVRNHKGRVSLGMVCLHVLGSKQSVEGFRPKQCGPEGETHQHDGVFVRRCRLPIAKWTDQAAFVLFRGPHLPLSQIRTKRAVSEM